MPGNYRSRKARLAAVRDQLRADGKSWAEIASVMAETEKESPLVAMRLAHGLSQTEVAERLSALYPDEPVVTFKMVSYWEVWPTSGHQPSLKTLGRLARLYDCRVSDLVDDRELARLSGATVEERTAAKEPGRLAEIVRHALTATPTPLRSPEPTSHDGDLSAMRAFRLADRQTGGGLLYGNVIAYLHNEVGPRLFGSLPAGKSSSSVFDAAASLTDMAGWMARDTGQDHKAALHFDRALQLARTSGNPLLCGHIYASMSHLALEMGRPSDALALARAGQQVAQHASANRDTLARLVAMEARGLAADREPSRCAATLARAEEIVGNESGADEPNQWAIPFDAAALATEAAVCYRDLNEYRQAEAHARQAVALRYGGERARSRALGLLLLADLYVRQARYDEACEVITEVLSCTHGVASFRIVSALRDLRVVLLRHAAIPFVGTLLDQVHEVLRGREQLYRWHSARSGPGVQARS